MKKKRSSLKEDVKREYQGLKVEDNTCRKRGKHTRSKLSTKHRGGTRYHACDQCKKSFISASNLKRHTLIAHEQVSRQNCSQCPRAFKDNWALVRHTTRVHTYKKPWKCTSCNASFSGKYFLESHLPIHNKE